MFHLFMQNLNMQSPKGRPSSLEVSKKRSLAIPRTPRKLKTQGSTDQEVRTSPTSKALKVRSSKVSGHRSPRSPAIEKKCPVKVFELESKLVQLQNDLKIRNDQLVSSDLLKQKAQHEAEEAKRHLAAMSKKLEETQKQLQNLSDSEQATLQELRKISQDRDRAWQSELEALQKQNCMDAAALASVMNEIQRLRVQLDRVAESEACQTRCADSSHAEIQNMRMELTENLSLVEELKYQISESKESEEQAIGEIGKAQMQLKVAKITEETMQSEITIASEAYKSLTVELELSQNRVSKLEEIVAELQAVQCNTDQALVGTPSNLKQENGEHRESDQRKAELSNSKLEAEQLRTALEVVEKRLNLAIRYQETHTCEREAEWEAKLEVARADAGKLKNELMEKELQLQNISEENKGLNQMFEESVIELEISKSFLTALMESLLDKDTELHCITEENDRLKIEVQRRELHGIKSNGEALAVSEAARASEQEALMKLGHVTLEADKSIAKAAHLKELLDAFQTTNSELESELRRLNVQADQWRKAAEAATAMLSTGNDGKYIERAGSLEYHTLGSPYSEDTDNESPKKKNGNMLKKIGTLLKKK